MARGVTGNGDGDQANNGRRHTVAKSKTTRRSTGNIAVPVLADTLRAAVDNFVAAGFDVHAGNLHGGLVLQFAGILQCTVCGSFVPTDFWQSDGCVNCKPNASTGTGEA